MKKQVIRLKHIDAQPFIYMGGVSAVVLAISAVLIQIIRFGLTLPPPGLLNWAFELIGIALSLAVTFVIGGALFAIPLGIINFSLGLSDGLALEFEITQAEEPAPARAPIRDLPPPPLDVPDHHQRRADAQAMLDAQSKILKR